VATKKNSLTLAILFHDDEKFLGSLLESILAQEDKSLSILALNNGSTDSSSEKMHKYTKRLKANSLSLEFLSSNDNLGEAIGLNKLASTCKTDYIAIIHGDDLLTNCYSKEIKKALNQEVSVDLVCPTLLELREDKENSKLMRSKWSRIHFINKFLAAFGNPGLMPGITIRTSLLRQLSAPTSDFRNLIFSADSIIWYRLSKLQTEILTCKRDIYLYRISPNQSTSSPRMPEMLALARAIRCAESNNLVMKFIARAGTSFDVAFVKSREEYFRTLSKLGVRTTPRVISLLINRLYYGTQSLAPKVRTY